MLPKSFLLWSTAHSQCQHTVWKEIVHSQTDRATLMLHAAYTRTLTVMFAPVTGGSLLFMSNLKLSSLGFVIVTLLFNMVVFSLVISNYSYKVMFSWLPAAEKTEYSSLFSQPGEWVSHYALLHDLGCISDVIIFSFFRTWIKACKNSVLWVRWRLWWSLADRESWPVQATFQFFFYFPRSLILTWTRSHSTILQAVRVGRREHAPL